jgi:hypothetical protein
VFNGRLQSVFLRTKTCVAYAHPIAISACSASLL